MGVTRSLDHTPIFQTMLSYQNQGNADFELTGTRAESLSVGQTTTKFDLTLALEPQTSAVQAPKLNQIWLSFAQLTKTLPLFLLIQNQHSPDFDMKAWFEILGCDQVSA